MEEPGQRPSNTEPFIREEAISPLRRGVENTITIICWVIYLYLILPLVTLVLWYFGVNTFYDQFIGARGYEDLINILKDGGITVLVVIFFLLSWSYYNYLWFRRRGERRGIRPREDNDPRFAELLCCTVNDMENVRKSSRLEISIEESKYRITSRE